MEESKRLKEEEERKTGERKRERYAEWARRESLVTGDKSTHVHDTWHPVEYEHTNVKEEKEITCIVRGEPGHFNERDVTCELANEKDTLVTYLPSEELISQVIELRSKQGEDQLKRPVYVSIPHLLTRSSAMSREPVVKALVDGKWKELPTRDVTFDKHKDTKFVQAEVHALTVFIVMSKFKRDYHTLTAHSTHHVTSSCDHRLSLDMEKETFNHTEHFLLQVQPVDSNTTQEFRTRVPHGKGLLNCSSIVHTMWETTSFNRPVQVTLSCPPNPAKAKKMALARKMKEEKMRYPNKPMTIVDDQEKEREKRRLQQFSEENGEMRKVNKWYMGEYANSDDDETDRLNFLYSQGGKWFVEPDMQIRQVKVDVLGFSLEHPVEKFVILRTRTGVEPESALAMGMELQDYMGKRFVEAVLRQRTDNPFDVALQVTPVSRVDAVEKQLAQHGFQSGPSPSSVICLYEGDIIEMSFSGNIVECANDFPCILVYTSNVPTLRYFTVKEENPFRQKDLDVFSGLLTLSRRYVKVQKGKKSQAPEDEQPEVMREKLCTLQINIPKYHIEPTSAPRKAPVSIRHNPGALDTDLLDTVAQSLGEEWKKLAHYLGVHRARVQSILRDVHVDERSEREAKYNMLMTWVKRATAAQDKVFTLSSALRQCGRLDLAETVQTRGGRDYDQMTSVN